MDKRTALSFVAVFIFCGGLSLSAAPDLILDAEGHSAPTEEVFQLSPAGEKKVKALSAFAEALSRAKNEKKVTPEVMDSLIETLRYDPNAGEPLKFLLDEWGRDKELSNCVERLLPIAQANPGALRLNVVTASVLKQSDREPEAVQLLEKSFQSINSESMKDQSFSDLVLILSSFYLDEERWSDGEALFRKAFKLENWQKDFGLRRGASIFYGRGSMDAPDDDGFWFFASSSRERYKKLFEENFSCVESLSAASFHQAGEFLPLLALCRELKQPERGYALVLQNLLSRPGDINSLSFLATFYYEEDDFNNAYRLWKQIFRKNKLDAAYYYELGRCALRAKQYREAINALEWFLMSNPDNDGALYQIGLAYFEMHMYLKALGKFRKLKSPEGFYMTAMCHRELSQYAEAVAALENAEKLAIEEGNLKFLGNEFYLTYAFFCEKAGMFEKGTKPLEKIIGTKARNEEVCNFLGYTWADYNINLDQAEQLIREALVAKPKEAAFLDSLAWVLFRKGKNKEALAAIEKALESSGELPDAVIADHAGDIYAANGDKEKALYYWALSLVTWSEDTDQDKIAAKISQSGGTPPAYKKFK